MGIFIISILALVGACFIAGSLTRNTDGTDKDKDHPVITIMRGSAVVAMIMTFVGIILGIVSIFVDIF